MTVFEAESVVLKDGSKVGKPSVEEMSEVVIVSELKGVGDGNPASDVVRPDMVGSTVTPLAPKEEEKRTVAELATGVNSVPLKELETTAVKFRFR